MTAGDTTMVKYWWNGGAQARKQNAKIKATLLEYSSKVLDHQRTTRRKENFSALTFTTPQCQMDNFSIAPLHHDHNCPTTI